MRSFNGLGGEIDDLDFCDTKVVDESDPARPRPFGWWLPFSEGKRFYVPQAFELSGHATNFNVAGLTRRAKELVASFGTHYTNSTNFGSKSFKKITSNAAMSFGKAVMATRIVNEDLAHKRSQHNGEVLQIGRAQVVMSGYRVDGLRAAVGHRNQAVANQPDGESGVELLGRESGIAPFIVEALAADDGRFVVFPTAHALTLALLRNRNLFGIGNEADEKTFIKRGPVRGASPPEIKKALSVEETDDPNFLKRVLHTPHPENPYRSVA